MSERRRTATSNFGVSGRESHDASEFYRRFHPPKISEDREIPQPSLIGEAFHVGDARFMNDVDDNSVALVVTSPPYFAGKQYEEELERDGIPASYLEYLDMLREVFTECVKKLEPGGRIAVNVANLGRKPYRSLSSDIIRIFEEDLGLLLRGEIIWQKAEGASGSCAWGSYRSASNPVIRDLTERVIVASKGRFDRARSVKERSAQGLPNVSTISTDDFLALTVDVWPMPPESARRIGHPAPFPVELPAKLIQLYTFADDLILDPFMGSGSTMVAASQLQRRFVGYDLDPAYVTLARERVRREGDPLSSPQSGQSLRAQAEELIKSSEFEVVATDKKITKTGITVDFILRRTDGTVIVADLAGSGTSFRGGLTRSEVVLRALGRFTAVRRHTDPSTRFILLTSETPEPKSEADVILRAAGPTILFDVVNLTVAEDCRRFLQLSTDDSEGREGFWTSSDFPSA